jgi:hydroxysqualene dehydroxylase
MHEPVRRDSKVVIVGSGWAGLAAAITLTRHRIPVQLIESARQPGGRARTVRSGELVVDNGQHLMIGAYQSMLQLMGQIGVDLDHAFERMPLTLKLINRKQTTLLLETPRLPAPWHLLAALLTARGLSVAEQIKALRFGHNALKQTLATEADISVLALLHSHAQSPGLIRKLWEPLCVATLNTPIDIASARLFITVLKNAFSSHQRHADLLIPRHELSDLLPRPGLAYLEKRGTKIELGQRVTSIALENDRVSGVNIGDRAIRCSHLVLATPAIISRRLISRHSILHALAQQLAELGNEPITTLYLQYSTDTKLDMPMVGLENSLGQWLFDRRICGQPGLMAVVISARGEHNELTGDKLTAHVIEELAACFPHWPAPENSLLLREKRATFCSRVGIDAIRPGNRTAVQGLWLAGDYTDTGLPATLESAVRSGTNCAQAMLEQPMT